MRVWPALLLLSCSRPNPAFLAGGASGDMSSETDPTTAAATTDVGTTAPSPTTGEVTTAAPTTSTGAPETTGPSGTTGVVETTGDEHPACGPFSEQRIVVDPPLLEPQCVAVTEYFGKVAKADDDTGTIALCTDASCGLCAVAVPLDPDLATYVDDGACLRVAHQGEWVPGDPEAPAGCKTTAIALFDDDSVYPLYAASSRVVDAPGFLDSAVRLDVQRDAGTVCDCAADDCCLEGQARNVRLTFTDHGELVGTLGPDEVAIVDFEGVGYLVAVIRAHVKGYFSTPTQRCVADPETAFVDWHMLRLEAP
ncbi:hypothetical protein SAMN02745121_00310 [Nannocystis exedens]|uniref:Uncharacterized protein n=1 Tax=Nannocystis exedens TaxID=54 RepID=A0A1I1SVL8_9BACT|nr:hypothetical protein [Nannocystis exedens]PCC66959.1 hypothetical protein NAEX_09558 [Nannocystis exedens]SFD50514.1 hypothetical protein SAMN02745121_00310 [Nannocystis exedens]